MENAFPVLVDKYTFKELKTDTRSLYNFYQQNMQIIVPECIHPKFSCDISHYVSKMFQAPEKREYS